MTDEELIARLREIQGQTGLFAAAAADRMEALLVERDAANALLREAREWLSCVEGYLRDGPQFLADAARIDAHLRAKP